MKVARGGGHRRVDVSMGIDPDEAQIGALLGMALHRTNGKAVPRGGEKKLLSSCLLFFFLNGVLFLNWF